MLTFFLQITVQDEGRDMWQVYLGLKEYAAALENCRDVTQRDRVYAAQVFTLTFPLGFPNSCVVCLIYSVINKIASIFWGTTWKFHALIIQMWVWCFELQAEAAFDAKDYERAASFYAKVHNSFIL